MAGPKPPVDPDATLLGAQQPDDDPDATVLHRLPSEPDPDATLTPDVLARMKTAAAHTPDRPAEIDADATMAPTRPEPEPSSEATVFIPTPGRRRAGAPAPAPVPRAPAPAAAPARAEAGAAELASMVGLNPLVAAANGLLSAVPQLRGSLRHPDAAGLRTEMLAGVARFEQLAKGKGYSAEKIYVARHALCALLDDSVQNTPWGAHAGWKSLVDELGHGQEDFFAVLNSLQDSPAANLEVLEFLAVCLALGYEGHYRKAPGGRVQLQQVRSLLNELVKHERGVRGDELSVRWRGLDVPMRRGSPWMFTWVTACVCAAMLVGVYLIFRVTLATHTEPVARQVASLKAKDTLLVADKAQPVTPRLKLYLAEELAAGRLGLVEDGVKSVVTISGDGLFAPGSDTMQANYVPLLLRIAQALNKVPGSIVITGHTDDQPIRTARYPSNWELSRERAQTVVKLMAGEIAEPARLQAEGLADSEPLAPNDSADNRAKNRRVTAILRVSPQQ